MKQALFFVCCFLNCLYAEAGEGTMDMQFLNGQWKLQKVEHVERELEEERRPIPDDNYWVFNKDQLTRYNYPFVFIGDIYFKLDSGGLYYYQSNRMFAKLQNDSGKLVATFGESVLTFHRDTFSSEVANCLNVLKRDTLNPGRMLEKYYRVTHFAPDDEESYDYTPPIRMSTSFTIRDSAEARTLIHSGVIYLWAGGMKREFHIVSVEWDGATYGDRSGFYVMDAPFIRLVPGDWWKGDQFSVIYRASEEKMIRSGSRNVEKVQ